MEGKFARIEDAAKNFLYKKAVRLNVTLHQKILVAQNGDSVDLMLITVLVRDVLIIAHKNKEVIF